MADEKDEGQGPFYLGRRYEEVEPGLGRLHEAWHVGTGRPALLLFPSDRVEWKPDGPWDVHFSCQPNAPSVTVMVDRSPSASELTQLADILVMMSTAVQCVEDNPHARAHLLEGTVKPPVQRASRAARGPWRFRAAMSAVALAVVALGLGVWLFLSSTPDASERLASNLAEDASSQTNAPLLSNSDTPRPAALSYPLPKRPFRNQAVAPCKPKPIEFEINGGCWVELAQKPPCADEFQAEFQGKCFLPVSKDRSGGRLPQSSKP
ncbi:hypothetical protein [Cystobacter ferrugineus]|uniref:Protein kinase n=1 Tax=Cystobacter ferrugineus TaxID=83449 RepID=A0A1L9AXD5_9BACT|nr:hypothetical protein [Cystobacter ferrugineus]OJH34681.1 hypothetical protein BON30_41710 [Cystobacter ferrugineus]